MITKTPLTPLKKSSTLASELDYKMKLITAFDWLFSYQEANVQSWLHVQTPFGCIMCKRGSTLC